MPRYYAVSRDGGVQTAHWKRLKRTLTISLNGSGLALVGGCSLH